MQKCLYDKVRLIKNNYSLCNFSGDASFWRMYSYILYKVSFDLGINKFLELGPGNGTLMSDIVRTISKLSDKKFHFYLYEKSFFLKKTQSKTLARFKSKEKRIFSINNLKLKKKPYIFFCNEFFDSLPLNQIEKKNNSTLRKRVSYSNKQFKLQNNLIHDESFNFLSNNEV